MAPDGSSTDSSGRCRCGQAIELDHQYCPACGTPTTESGSTPSLDPADEPLLLLGSSRQSTAEITVRTGGGGLMARLVGLGLAVAAVILVWSLFRQPSSEVAPEPANEEAVADTEPDQLDDDEDTADAAEDPTEESATTTTGPPGQGPTSSDPSGTRSGADRQPVPPLLGEETGLRLALGRAGRSALQIIDLDSGDIQEVDDVSGRPVGSIGSTLVLYDENDGRTAVLDVDDIEAGAVQIGNPSEYLEVVEVTEDRIWAISDGEDGLTLRGLNPDGVIVEELDFPLYGRFGYGPWSLVRPSELLYDPAGGLYRRTDDGFELVAEGQVLAAGERLAVIRQCDENLDCQLRWYDLNSSGVIGFPAPPPSEGQGFYQLLGGDRWLAYFDWQNERAQLIEVATARITRELNMENFFRFGPGGTAISSDGRWLVDVVDQMLVVVDLENGAEWPIGIRGIGVQAAFMK